MSSLFVMPFVPALGVTGLILPGATLTFYETGTTTLVPIYDEDGDPLANPLSADISGRFPPIYLDDAITYRVILKSALGVTIDDIDPFATPLGVISGPDGAASVGIKRNATGTVTQTVKDMLLETVHITEFGAAFDVGASANIADATDDTAAWNAALAYLVTVGGGTLVLPPGASKTTAVIDIPVSVPIRIVGSGMRKVYPGAFVAGVECPSTVVPYHTGRSAFRFLASVAGQGGFCGENWNVATLEDATQPDCCFGFETQGAFLYGFTFHRIGVHGFKKSGSGYPWEAYFSGGTERAVGAVVIDDCTINRNNWIIRTQSTCQINAFKFTNNEAGQNLVGGISIAAHSATINDNILEGQPNPVKLAGAYQATSIKGNYFELNTGIACIDVSESLSVDIGPNNYQSVNTLTKVVLRTSGLGSCIDAYWPEGPHKMGPPLRGASASNNLNNAIVTDAGDANSIGFYRVDMPANWNVSDRPTTVASVGARVVNPVREQNPFTGEAMPIQEYTTTGTGIVSMTSTISGSSGQWVVASVLFKRTPDLVSGAENPFITLNVNNTSGNGTRGMNCFNFNRYWIDGEFVMLTAAIKLGTAMTSLGVYLYPFGISPTAGRVARHTRPYVYVLDDINKVKPYLDHFMTQSVTAAPTTGTWVTGDILLNSAGGFFRCTAGGSPGTWGTI